MPSQWWPMMIEVMGVLALGSIIHDLRTGQDVNRGVTVDRRENPAGFWFLIALKAGIVCFAIAEILFAIGLIQQDPFAVLEALTGHKR